MTSTAILLGDTFGKSHPLTSVHEDYLKSIYLLHNEGTKVTNSALANYLKITPASATNMVKKLAEWELITYEPYQSILLTEMGNRVALEVLRHHRLLELFLHEKLNLPLGQVHEEAERLEHVLSDVLEEAIVNALGNPTIDPHGDPIPAKDGTITPVDGIALNEADLQKSYRVVRVLVQDQERLDYLHTLGLYPNANLVVMSHAPLNEPLLIQVQDKHHALSYEMAQCLLVMPEESL